MTASVRRERQVVAGSPGLTGEEARESLCACTASGRQKGNIVGGREGRVEVRAEMF